LSFGLKFILNFKQEKCDKPLYISVIFIVDYERKTWCHVSKLAVNLAVLFHLVVEIELVDSAVQLLLKIN